MKLHLKRPIAFFDLETTGVNISADRIVEIAILKIFPDQSQAVMAKRVNPGIPIPLESSLIHGIYDADVAAAPKFGEIAQEIADFIGDADLAGYNSNKFDIPLLMEEFLRDGTDFSLDGRHFVDVQNIFHQMEQRTLKAAYKFYCDKSLDNAHNAEADVRATYEVLLSQLARYEDVEWEDKAGNVSKPVVNNVEALHNFTNLSRPVDFAGRMVFDEHGQELFNFGKHKGRTVESVFEQEPSYFQWMMQGDFPLYTKQRLEVIWKRFKEKQKEQKLQGTHQPSESQTRTGQKPTPRPQAHDGQAARRPQHSRPGKPKPITGDMLKNLQDKFGKQS